MPDINRDISIEQVDYSIDINNIEYSIEIEPQQTYELLLNEQGPQGLRGESGADGTSAEIVGATATISNTVGIPSVSVAMGGTSTERTFSFEFENLKGADGQDGQDGQDGTAATINVGTVSTGAAGTSATVVNSGTENAAILDFIIPRGDKGDQGVPGQDGTDGTNATITGVTASVDSNVGTPSVSVTMGGTESTRTFDFAFHNLKGADGMGAVDSVNGQTGTVVLTATDVGALPSTTTIGSANTTVTVNGTSVGTINANATVDGSLPITYPTTLSSYTNDSGFITGIDGSDVTTALGYTPADTTLSNVSSIDANSAVQTALDTKLSTSQITNCLTEIPQRLNIVYNNDNTLTVKAGSILTIPYGITDQSSSYSVGDTFIDANFKVVDTDWDDDNSLFFVHVEVQEDITSTAVSSSSVTNSCVTVRLDNNGISVYNAQGHTGSGTTGMTNTGVYYNTSTNKIVYYSSGSAQTYTGSFPIAYVYSNAEGTYAIDKIDIVCNGFGYIGSTIFADKGIKGLAPNGRNSDGSLKSIEFTTSHVFVANNYVNNTSIGNSGFSLGANSIRVQYRYIESNVEPKTTYTSWYNPIENKRYYRDLLTDNWIQTFTVYCGKATWAYANSAMTFESISQPKVIEVAKASDLDGEWIYDGSGKTIAASVSFSTSAQEKTYDLSSWLPNDGCTYEVLFSVGGQTAAASGASFNFGIKTDVSGGNVPICRNITRTASYVNAIGSCIIPLKNRIITVRQSNTTNAGAPTLNGIYGLCYKKVR